MKKILSFLFIINLVLVINAQRFVSTTGSGSMNGTSWSNAYPASSLATVIATGGTIYLKEGTYVYTNSNVNITTNNTVIQGGFPKDAIGTDISGYNPCNRTVINRNNITGNLFTNTTNSLNSFTMKGLTFEKVNNGSIFSSTFGNNGIVNFNFLDLTIRKCTSNIHLFTFNAINTGNSSKVKFLNCLFTDNKITQGGQCLISYSNCGKNSDTQGSHEISKSIFSNNTGKTGIINLDANKRISLLNNTFCSNSTDTNSGVISFTNNENIVTNNNVFNNNSTTGNGGIASSSSDSNLTFSNNTFSNNSSASNGGVLYFINGSNLTLTSNGFYNNSSKDAGGAVYVKSYGISTFNTNTFYGNTLSGTSAKGGAVYVETSSFSSTSTGNIYVENKVPSGGKAGALFISSVSNTLNNNSFYNNRLNGNANVTDCDIDNSGGGFTISNSKMQLAGTFSYTGVTWGSGNTFGNAAVSVSIPIVESCANSIVCCSDSTTWNGTSWSNGLPTTTKDVFITGAYDFNTASPQGSFSACSCSINGQNIVVNSGKYLESISNVTTTNGGTLTIEHGGNFVQRDAYAFVPQITLNTLTRAIANHAWVHRSSPVLNNGSIWSSIPFGSYSSDLASQPTNQYRTGSLHILNNAAWVNQTNDSNLAPGRGFILRTTGQRFTNSPIKATGNTNNTTVAARPLNFSGTSNNGDYEIALQSDGIVGSAENHTTITDQNLIGNPYPSAIDANDFLAANSTDIFGTIYIWTSPMIGHDGKYPHSSGFATYNGTMGVASGTDGSFTPTRFIAPGQGFQVYATCGDCTGKKIVFSNDMRETTETGGRKFAREKEENNEKIYLSLKDYQTNLTSRIGIGYVEGATKLFDNKYDAPVISSEPYKFYSKASNYKVIINGRPKFDTQDKIELGFEVMNENVNTFEISLDYKEGNAFANGVDILLKDKVLNVVHNLSKSSKYAFVSSSKEVTNRFEILYVDTKPKQEAKVVTLTQVAVNKGNLVVKSDKLISEVEVYDLAGSLVAKLDAKNDIELVSTINTKALHLVVKVFNTKGEVETFKVVNN